MYGSPTFPALEVQAVSHAADAMVPLRTPRLRSASVSGGTCICLGGNAAVGRFDRLRGLCRHSVLSLSVCPAGKVNVTCCLTLAEVGVVILKALSWASVLVSSSSTWLVSGEK